MVSTLLIGMASHATTGAATTVQDGATAVGTLLPRGFFLVSGLLYIASLGLHRVSTRLAIPSSLPILLLGLAVNVLRHGIHNVSGEQVETLHTASLALLLFYAGLNTDLERIRGRLRLALLLPTLGVALMGIMLGLLLWSISHTGLPWMGRAGLAAPLPIGVALLTAICLLPTDGSASEESCHLWGRTLPRGVLPVLAFEAALGSASAILGFGLVLNLFLGVQHGGAGAFQLDAIRAVPMGLFELLRHLLAGLGAGLVAGVLGNRLIRLVVLHREHLLILAISMAFVAYALGNLLGGGGLISVYTAGLVLANRPNTAGRFDHGALRSVLLPFNTAAEFTMLLLLGLVVNPAVMVRMLPLGMLLGVLLELVVRPVVVLLLGGAPRGLRLERLLVSAGGMRAAVPLALSLSLVEQVPRMRGVHPLVAEDLASELTALVAVAVITSLLLKGVVLQRLTQRLLPPA
jgi:cell volume regulation protein A